MPSGPLEQLPEWALRVVQTARVGHLGLIDTNHHPRVLPVTYAIYESAAWTAIDNKPKRADHDLARVRWVRERPKATLTIDVYDDDWSALRWVQLIGEIAVLDGAPTGGALDALTERYPQYRADRPPGPFLRLAVQRTVWWRAS